jgi:hypothetical protein
VCKGSLVFGCTVCEAEGVEAAEACERDSGSGKMEDGKVVGKLNLD